MEQPKSRWTSHTFKLSSHHSATTSSLSMAPTAVKWLS
ncbi:unnamed protein product [Dibothriocephalus latus]|uniref:Uncharacterized protein n=1 Tax=Dibothriocephalus latus TaxID=60516 RepID=A0A3P6PRA3_DIBLA|nr:unnamed protein product [Dibothriocephalus latus]